MTPTHSLGPANTIRLHHRHKPRETPDDPHGLTDWPKDRIEDVLMRFDTIRENCRNVADKPCECGSSGLRVYNVTSHVSRTQCKACGLVAFYTIGRP